MEIKSPIKDSIGKKDGDNLIFSCETSSDVFSPIKGKTTTGTTNSVIEITSYDNNYILQLFNVTNSLGSNKNLDNGINVGKSKEEKVTIKFFKKDGTQVDASSYYKPSSISQDDEKDEDVFVDFMSRVTKENVSLEINRIKQLLK